MRVLRDKLTYANVMATVAVFIAIGGATAFAVDGPNPGQNTIGSEDVIGNEIKSDDIGNGRIFNLDIADEIITGAKLKNGTVTGDDVDESTLQGVGPAENWTPVQDNPLTSSDPCDALQTAIFCGTSEDLFAGWTHYSAPAGTFERVAFYKDSDSVVHLRGLARPSSTFPGSRMFLLPSGYRPQKQRLFSTICYSNAGSGNMSACRVDIDSAGFVHWINQNSAVFPSEYITLEDISFRVP